MKEIRADKDELNFPPSAEVLRALRSCDVETFRRYRKDPPLLEALAAKHALPKERIFLEQGVIGVIHRVFDYVAPSDAHVLLPELGYPYYHRLASSKGIKRTTFKIREEKDSFSYDLNDLLEKLQEEPTAIVLIDPESPLGFSLPTDTLQTILERTPKDTLIVLDQSHEGFREEHVKDVSALVENFGNLLVARGFSKFYGLAGARIAYALCGERVKEMIHFNERYLGFDNIAQQLALAALCSEQHYIGNALQIREEKRRFTSAIRALPGYRAIDTDSASSLVLVPPEQRGMLSRHAKAARIHIRDLGEYHQTLDGLYRVTMCPPDETERLIDLFSSVSWLYGLNVENTEAKPILDTRDAGYSIHRREVPFDRTNLVMGVHRVIVPPGRCVPEHRHGDQDELFEFHTDAYFELHGRGMQLSPGDWVRVGAGNLHSIRAPDDRFARFIALRFPYILQDKYTADGAQVVHERT